MQGPHLCQRLIGQYTGTDEAEIEFVLHDSAVSDIGQIYLSLLLLISDLMHQRHSENVTERIPPITGNDYGGIRDATIRV